MTQDVRLKPYTLQDIKEHTGKDDSLQELIKVIIAGWLETKGNYLILYRLTSIYAMSLASTMAWLSGEREN